MVISFVFLPQFGPKMTTLEETLPMCHRSSSDIGFVDLFYDLWIQKLHHFYGLWIQKAHHFYDLWIQNFCCPFLQFLDPGTAVFLQFLDPETAPFLQFLAPYRLWGDICLAPAGGPMDRRARLNLT